MLRPDDAQAWMHYASGLLRAAEASPLRALEDHRAWAAMAPALRDAAIAQVSRASWPMLRFSGTRARGAAPGSPALASFIHAETGLELLLLPGGRFFMGSESGNADEQPRHRVHVPPFLLGRFPVDQATWDQALTRPRDSERAGPGWLRQLWPSTPEPRGDERYFEDPGLPIHGISWGDAEAWLGLAGGRLRMPSEREWEYAYRAGTTSRFFWGERFDASYCWHGLSPGHKVRAAREHLSRANPFGLVDIAGNVLECCADHYSTDYRSPPVGATANLSPDTEDRVSRGGSWRDHQELCRAADRRKMHRDTRSWSLGLRVAMSLPESLSIICDDEGLRRSKPDFRLEKS